MSGRYYGTRAWRRLRDEVVKRQPVCATPGCGRPSTVADHIVPRSRGGRDELGNLRGLCASCHGRVTRQGNSKPLSGIGCDADGRPRDKGHWWNS